MVKNAAGIVADTLKEATAFTAALLLVMTLCACGGGDTSVQEKSDITSAGQAYPVGSYERMAADRAASGENEPDGKVIDFGSKSIFKGIKVESDENGELVCDVDDGELWYRITDSRFGSYAALKKYIKKKAGKNAVEQYALYFWEKDGDLYFVNGAKGRGVKDQNLYYLNDATKLTVSATHTPACAKNYGITRSDINFVRNKKDNNVWKLDSLVIYSE